MKLVRPRLGEVVDLRRPVTSLIDRVGVGVHCGFLQGVQSNDKIRGKPDIQSEKWIVRVEAVKNIAVRGRRQSIELDIAVAARGLGVVRRSCRIHQCARRKLRDIGQVLTWVGQALEGLLFERGGCIRVFKTHQPRLRGDFDGLRRGCERQREIDSGGLPHRNAYGLRLSGTESRRVDHNAVGSRIHLAEEEAPVRVT